MDVTDGVVEQWFPYVFPFLFVGMWLLIATMLGVMSGWFNLQQWYPDDGSEEPLLKLGGQSGSMGAGVTLGGILKLRAYRSGLGIRIWRVFGPFQKPLRVPWSEIEAEKSSSFFSPTVKLHLGKPANGTLKISARSWERLVNAVPQSETRIQMPAAAPVRGRSIALSMIVQWLMISGVAGAFFYFASRSNESKDPLPLGICVGFPAVVFGIGQLFRYARER
jgi:hypothetical protein